jgi:hypothetical protein
MSLAGEGACAAGPARTASSRRVAETSRRTVSAPAVPLVMIGSRSARSVATPV